MIDLSEILFTLTLLDPSSAPRLLDAEAQALLASRFEAACPALRQSSATEIELRWGGDVSAATLALQPSSSDTKQFYIAWLKDRYAYNISKLNAAYGLEATSFSDLAESDFRRIDRARPAVRRDDAALLADLESLTLDRVRALVQSCTPVRKLAWKRSRQ